MRELANRSKSFILEGKKHHWARGPVRKKMSKGDKAEGCSALYMSLVLDAVVLDADEGVTTKLFSFSFSFAVARYIHFLAFAYDSVAPLTKSYC